MTTASGNRSDFFPAIEAKHGKPISHWKKELAALGEAKYQDQMDLLQKKHKFSRQHANALVMHVRGSTTSKRFATPEQYFASLPKDARAMSESLFATIQKKYPELELVIAWNQPMLRVGKSYIIGVSASKNHLTINPFSVEVLQAHLDSLKDFVVNKNTFQVPINGKITSTLLLSLVRTRLAEI